MRRDQFDLTRPRPLDSLACCTAGYDVWLPARVPPSAIWPGRHPHLESRRRATLRSLAERAIEKTAAADSIDAARARAFDAGVAQAEASDLKLKLQESLEREKNLIERALRAEEALEDAMRNEHDLRDQIERLVSFNRAVEQSGAWKLIQALRGLVGRKW